MTTLGHDLIDTEQLRKRWRLKSRHTVRKILHRYKHILQPTKPGKELLCKPANVEKYEQERKILQ